MAEESSAEEQETSEPEEFLNRAARRAKGKKHGQASDLANTAAQQHGRSSVPGRRNYGNRRSG